MGITQKESVKVKSQSVATYKIATREDFDEYLAQKRIDELFLILLASPIIILITLFIALVVFIDLRNEIIYKQTRIGRHEKLFTMYKFRTMRKSNDNGEKKITSIGGLLRKYRLDELPQFWNVIIGDMSLIGPRPEKYDLYYEIKKELPAYQLRTLVQQGITGKAQVMLPHTSDLEGSRKKLIEDISYISDLSVANDLIILLKTIATVVTGKGK
jgi:lipopolysaccharide/colanic/teichoic acid biosynthesis glycosyltransferase